ncbi:hypothetical protein OG787_25210 [Streptomyces sp. NBC_00075]|uniref:hypothetical protein n=1 Tax=Streptomyces sp. NBC_00075 TaxID=2975641 RepID=UPI0032540352
MSEPQFVGHQFVVRRSRVLVPTLLEGRMHPERQHLLTQHRGAAAGPQDVTVCTSVTDGVRRVCQTLRAQGITAVSCEKPGWTRLREVIAAAGLRAVLTTPTHQFPLGSVLVPERRAALPHRARRVDDPQPTRDGAARQTRLAA